MSMSDRSHRHGQKTRSARTTMSGILVLAEIFVGFLVGTIYDSLLGFCVVYVALTALWVGLHGPGEWP